jgi:uncharacterized membrane protein (UPF0127 family)
MCRCLCVREAVIRARPHPHCSTASAPMTSVWLVCDGRVLASAEVAASGAERRRGLLGRDGLDGALLLQRTRWVHTLGMRFPIDVAYLDAEGNVLKTMRMGRHRVGVPVLKARTVVEAEAGAFGRWGLHVGDRVEVRA